ncbi:NEL-type E3 ubiquitin ligase domain-containing protein [Pseudomonas sp. GD04058]|uniref:dermonecrotic toxin domain-containing protein n=2 Tax=Pseudomonas TaxID=286 RepID=UPI00244ADBF9|nr:DUF6543 domain-containing protein [Pseudomonas sp. GD04058]MDG9883624.1 NEL-type E3 ubiquitin ligase domain-containing protein [Pseudomonas sp. GD04058]
MSEKPEPDIHYRTVSQRVAPDLLARSTQERQALRARPPQPMPWLAAAGATRPDLLDALRREYPRHRQLAEAVDGWLKPLPDAQTFAEPLLRDALQKTFGMDLDVRHTFLFNAARARVAEAHLKGSDPVVKAFQVVKAATRTLLQAALQNFEAYEAEAGGMQDERRPSMIFTSETGQPLEPGRQLDLVPERFAALCRTLDLGGRYQRLIAATFEPSAQPWETAEVAKIRRRSGFKALEQSAFRLNLHLAYLQGWIGQGLYDDLLEVAKNGKAGSTLGRAMLRLWEVELNGIVVFFRPRPPEESIRELLVYLPDEPNQPLREFRSIPAFNRWLGGQLRDTQWRKYFLRFIPARQRESLQQRIHRTLNPKVWNPGGWYEERADPKAVLHLGKRDFSAPLFNALLQRKIAVLKDDGLFHAVPTAVENHKSAQAKIDYWLGLGFDALNLAAFVVPGLGEVMLAVNVAMLGYEVYEGFDSLTKGEREQAWNYFLDVAENLAVMAALGAAGAAAHRFTGNLPLAVRSMRPVRLADGSVRLWKPDLAPFAYDIELPAGLEPDENGLYAYQGREWLALDGRYYSVRTLLGTEQGFRLEHPDRPWAYEPTLRHNGNGGWLHELDTPEQWRGMELFGRQGHREARVSEAMAQRAMRISSISEAQLRHTLVNSHRPPALLTDTLRRLSLAETLEQAGNLDANAFKAGYIAQLPRLSVQGQVLQRQFPGLPNGLVEEILASANEHELSEMAAGGRVSLRVAEEARRYLEQVRIARACEGLYLDYPVSVDAARLMFHGLEGLPNWPKGGRMALVEASPGSEPIATIGSGDEGVVTVVLRRGSPLAFCQALFDAIPPVQRTGLALDDAAALRRMFQEQPLAPRQRLRQWLGMQVLRPGFRSPLRLADGRLGYPLSGRGQGFFTEDELLDKLRLLELDDLYPEDALWALYRSGLDRNAIDLRLNRALDEMQALRQHLDRWVMDSAREVLSHTRQRSRERIGNGLWDHWRRNTLPELGRPAAPLVFWQVQLADLPVGLPSFFRERVGAVLLDEVILREGEGFQQVIGADALLAFAEEFPRLRSLDIRAGAWEPGLAQTVARAWPELGALALREISHLLSHPDIRALAGLPRLRWLELRGSRLLDLPVSALNGMQLDYLGLDWLDLGTWPHWLDTLALERIGSLSLVGNRLTEVPRLILEDPEPAVRTLRIAARGNQFGYQACFDMVMAERFHGRYSFDLGLSPAMADELNRRVQERAQLQDLLEAWVNADQADVPLTPEHRAYRHRIAGVLLEYWRDTLRGLGAARLNLVDVVLTDFPEALPAFLTARIDRLDLTRFDAEPAVLERFVMQFPQLAELSLVGGSPAMVAVPGFLTRLPQLRELALVRVGMTIDQAAMEVFARMPVLSSLQLDGNRLGQINDVSMFDQRFFGYLGLAQMDIAVWPAWLNSLLPHGIELLGLDDNLLTELPEQLLENRRTEAGVVEISLHNNPLTRATLIRAHTSQHFSRPYTFTLDLPEDIAAMPREVHESDSDDSGSPGTEDTWMSDDDPAATWETGDVADDARHELLWAGLSARGDAGALLALVSRLRHSADYRTASTRMELVERVWTVLEAANDDAELRLTLNGMAEEPVAQVHNHDTCPDGIRMEFNQMELLVHTRQALRQIPAQNRGPALFRLMRGNFRAQRLDSIARERANGRDEAEVRLAYRLRWAEQLELPLPPRGMLYRRVADIAPGELDQALIQLQLEEAGAGLQRFAAQCDFWVAYLREAFAERFKALKDAYEAAVLGTIDVYPNDTAEQSAERIRALEDKFKRDERELLERLTLEQSLSTS